MNTIPQALLIASPCLLLIALTAWELLSGHRKSAAADRSHRLHLRLGVIFCGLGVAVLWAAAWCFLPDALAVILSFVILTLLVVAPLLFFLFADVFPKRPLHKLPPTNEPLQIAASSKQAEERPEPQDKDENRKWWARRWAKLRLGRYGIWR